MIYVIADIHGCYDEFRELLGKIGFSDADTLYVLGDAVDRGPEPIRVLRDLMARPNAFLICGNHEYMMLRVVKKLAVEITEDNAATQVGEDELWDFTYWMKDGGGTTCRQFAELSREEQEDIIDYVGDAELYVRIAAGGHRYVLVHAGLGNAAGGSRSGEAFFDEDPDIDSLTPADLLMTRPNYGRRYFRDPDTFLVTGHTPTVNIRADRQPLVYEENGHIAIDCGCVFGGRLAALRLDDGAVFYVDAKEEDTDGTAE